LRGKFKEDILKDVANVISGIKTGNNNKLLRFWWEICKKKIDDYGSQNGKKWILYAKGGPYNKWWGNLWICINWQNNGQEIRKTKNFNLIPEEFSFLEGITYSASGSKGINFRYLPEHCLFDMGGSSIFPNFNLYYVIAFLNSKLNTYLIDCLNPTVNKQKNDLERTSLILPKKDIEKIDSILSQNNIDIKKHLCEFSIIEMNYKYNPIIWAKGKYLSAQINELLKTYLDYENGLNTQIYLNEALIDELVFQVYQVTEEDKEMILAKEGVSIGSLPLLVQYSKINNQVLPEVDDYIKKLEVKQLDNKAEELIKKRTLEMYQQNYSLEEICKELSINPVSIAGIIKDHHVLPKNRCQEIIQNLLFDLVRELLQEDPDGIIPLIKISGEDTLKQLLYHKLAEKGFSHIQIEQLKQTLGNSFENYLEKYFFRDLANRLNLFMYLPKTPFIWHLSSGENQGFEAYISIYKWNKDKLYRLKSVYIEKRESSLKNRLSDLSANTEELELKYQKEKELIQKQLKEIKDFKQKIDEILMTAYDPKLDDGVGKNIAPLQEKGLLKCEVLKKKELKKYLNADWQT
jgi:hypothetical protein